MVLDWIYFTLIPILLLSQYCYIYLFSQYMHLSDSNFMFYRQYFSYIWTTDCCLNYISSVSSSSIDEGSPEQMVPRSGNVSDIRVTPQPNPNMYCFMPLRDSHDMQTTDSLSEHSDMTESTDISDQNISLSGSPGSGFQPIRQTHLWCVLNCIDTLWMYIVIRIS